jgi:TatD DNase family protein
LIDSHAHLHFDRFDEDRDVVIERARDRGITSIVTIGTHLESSAAAIELAVNYTDIFATAGVHPLAVDKFKEADWANFESMWQHEKVVGVGETGLDYYYTPETRDLQLELFKRHLKAGRKFNLPVVVHIRDAFDDAFELLERHLGSAGGIVHCFTGGVEACAKAVALDMYVSLSGIATFKNAKDLRAAIPLIPDERVLVETDSPYLAPVPHRGERCEPAFVYETAQAVAALRGVEFDALCQQTKLNTERVFNKMAVN